MTAATGRPNGNDSADDRRRELRETISAVALDLVLERGLDAVTVDEISRASNVSRRTFFNYFPSKVAACIPEMIPAQDEAIEQFLTDFSVPTMTALSRLLWLQVSNARRQSSAFDKFHDMWRREPGIRSEVHEILDRAEERVAALVEPAPGVELDLDALREHLVANLAKYKVPERIVVVDAFPRNAMGKIVRIELVALLG